MSRPDEPITQSFHHPPEATIGPARWDRVGEVGRVHFLGEGMQAVLIKTRKGTHLLLTRDSEWEGSDQVMLTEVETNNLLYMLEKAGEKAGL